MSLTAPIKRCTLVKIEIDNSLIMVNELNDYIKKGKTKLLFERVLEHSEETPFWHEVKEVALQNISQLSIIQKEKNLGIIKDDFYFVQINKINWHAIQLVEVIKENRFEGLNHLRIEKNKKRESRLKEANLLDKFFKILLLIVMLISFTILIRSLLLLQIDIQEKLLQSSISLIGGFGAFFGYYKWRLTELN